jgi:branched-chain amino acid transport system substrate-binding protein
MTGKGAVGRFTNALNTRGGRKMKRLLLVCLILGIGAGLVASEALAAQKVLKLGAAVSMTGRLSKEGSYVKDGYTLWMEEVNKRGGIKVGNDVYKVEIIFYDDKGDPETAAKLTEKLITEDKVQFLLGPYGSGITLATSAIGEKYHMLTIACEANANKIYERGFKYIVSILPPATYGLRPIVDMSQAVSPKVKTAAVIWADDLFPTYIGSGAMDYCKQRNIDVVYQGTYPKDVKDLSSILLAAKAKKPDMLLGGTYFNDCVLIVKQMKEQNFNEKILGVSVGPELPAYVKVLGNAGDYVTGFEWWTPIAKWHGAFWGTPAEFAKKMEERFGYVPSYHPTSSAVAGTVLATAIEKAGTLDTDKVTETIKNMKITTVWGPMAWNKQGQNIEVHSSVVQELNGVVKVVYPFEASDGKLVYPMPAWGTR